MNRFRIAFVSALTSAFALQACNEEPQSAEPSAAQPVAPSIAQSESPEAPVAREPRLVIQSIQRLDGLGEEGGAQGNRDGETPLIRIKPNSGAELSPNNGTNVFPDHLPFYVRCLPGSNGKTYKIAFTVTDSFDGPNAASDPQELTVTCNGCQGDSTCTAGDTNSHCVCNGTCSASNRGDCACKVGYYQQTTETADDGKCIACSTQLAANHHCDTSVASYVTCDADGSQPKCHRCIPDYYVNNDACSGCRTITHCDTTNCDGTKSTDAECIQCSPNYYITDTGDCSLCSTSAALHCRSDATNHFSTCDGLTHGNAYCKSCAANYYLNTGNTPQSCDACSTWQELHCKGSGADAYTGCSAGSEANTAHCVACENGFYAQGSGASLVCKGCGANDDTASTAPTGCTAWTCEVNGSNKTNKCTACDNTHYLQGNACVAASECASGTYADDTTHQCESCQANSNANAKHCATYTCTRENKSTALCTSCSGELYLQGNACVAASDCASGTYADSTTHQCEACQASSSASSKHCVTYTCTRGNKSTALCTSCDGVSYYLSGNSCLNCATQSSLHCSQNGFHACTSTTNAYCTQCASGYYDADSSSSFDCQSCQVTDCAECTAARKCTRCNQGQVINSGQTCCYISGCQNYGNTECECLD